MRVNAIWIAMAIVAAGCASRPPVHTIRVTDDATGRGVPLVELSSTNNVSYWTDSNGIVAFDEPGLMGRRVWLTIKSSGYEYPNQFFGSRGASVITKPGATTDLKIKRTNIAQRLYRITGLGIYRDSVLAGLPVPTKNPLVNGEVAGQDSVQCVQYKGKLHWFWGDTGRVAGPLGNFSMSGATSELPAHGGLDPSVGVDLHYFTDPSGFCRPMMDVPGKGPKWASGLMVLDDDTGRQRLVAEYVRVSGLAPPLERSLALWNDDRQVFEKWKELDLTNPLYPDGQPLRVAVGGRDYFYFPLPYAMTRVPADWTSIADPKQYEAFTCLAPGTRYEKEKSHLDRDPAGKLRWSWKRDTAPLRESDENELIKLGLIKPSEAWYQLKDLDTNTPVIAHGGSVAWNPYRHKYIMIFTQIFGSPSMVGEVWFTESDHPEGPYTRAKKIATHDRMDFYNPVHHPLFDQRAGRIIYFEGTYTNTFSGNPTPTPRYNYNQLMYRLDLADPRLKNLSE